MFAIMTTRQYYRMFLNQLNAIYGPGEASVITEWVFDNKANLKRSDVLTNPDRPLSATQQVNLEEALHLLLLHKPVQYVIGEAWFCNLKFVVNEAVLIPRPETEELVQQVVQELKTAGAEHSGHEEVFAPLRVLDIGTGSGCIAIAIKKNFPTADVHAIDLDDAVLKIAKKNAAIHDVTISFLEMDILNNQTWDQLPVFDVIVSNPPYIPVSESVRLAPNVTEYEPHQALFVPDERPMLFYEEIADLGLTHLHPDGKIFVEVHEDLAQVTATVFAAKYEVSILNDMFGKQRMLAMVRKKDLTTYSTE